jgi:hypothetical protein
MNEPGFLATTVPDRYGAWGSIARPPWGALWRNLPFGHALMAFLKRL